MSSVILINICNKICYIKNYCYFCIGMNNLRFSTAVHNLVILDKYQGEFLTSDFIAGSINVNPVVVRREIKLLREVGFIEAKKGKVGGCTLATTADKILLGDLYKIVNKDNMLGRKNQTNPECSIGKQMNEKLDILFEDTDKQLIDLLNRQSLQDFSNQFN